MSFCAIDDKRENKLQVIWDLGRFCNYNCSYCPPHRSNNWSGKASLTELISTVKTLQRYNSIYNRHRQAPFKITCSFTGGEPTANPTFFDFIAYMKSNLPNIQRTITTNGFYNSKQCQYIIDNIDYATVSYHCEASDEQKKIVRRNIEMMKKSNYNFKVNVMFHKQEDYFNECINLCEKLDSVKVNYVPRVIGDSNTTDKLNLKTVHIYTKKQIEWFSNFWLIRNRDLTIKNIHQSISSNRHNKLPNKNIVGQSIGRPCCGGRTLDILDDEDTGWKTSDFIPNTNFRGWSCMINWYFLYINQEIDFIYHGQTCQINLDGEMGPICRASKFDKYCDALEFNMNKSKINYIRCPKKYCGCGLCAPKAKDDKKALEIFNDHTHNIVPQFMKKKKYVYINSIQNKIELLDKGKIK